MMFFHVAATLLLRFLHVVHVFCGAVACFCLRFVYILLTFSSRFSVMGAPAPGRASGPEARIYGVLE